MCVRLLIRLLKKVLVRKKTRNAASLCSLCAGSFFFCVTVDWPHIVPNLRSLAPPKSVCPLQSLSCAPQLLLSLTAISNHSSPHHTIHWPIPSCCSVSVCEIQTRATLHNAGPSELRLSTQQEHRQPHARQQHSHQLWAAAPDVFAMACHPQQLTPGALLGAHPTSV